MQTEGRVVEAERLFTDLDRGGKVQLAVLTDDDECVLGDGRWAMTDASVWTAWMSRSDDQRAAATKRVVGSLVARGIVLDVAEQSSSVRLELSPPAGLIAAARSQPFFVVSALSAPPVIAPVAYAVVDDVAGLRGVVVELRGDGAHDYRLLSVERAAEGLATWAHDAVTSDRWGARCETVVLEVFRHREEEPLEAAGLKVTASEGGTVAAGLLFGGRRVRSDSAHGEGLATEIECLLRQAAETPSRSIR